MTTTSPAVRAWDRWLRAQAHRADPVGDLARDYLDECARRGRPMGAGVMRLRLESEGNREAFAALQQAWHEFTAAVPQPDPQPPVRTRHLDRATAKRLLAMSDAQDLQLAQHRLVEDVDGGPAGMARTTAPMTFVPEIFGWTRAELETDHHPDDDDEQEQP